MMRLCVLLFCSVGVLAGQGDECTELTQSNVTAYMGTAINAAVCWHTMCNGNMQLTFGAELFMTGWVKIAGDTSVTVNGGDLHGDITHTVAASGPVTISALVTGYRTSRCPSGWPNEWCYSRWVSTNLTNYVNFEWVCIDSTAPQTNTHPPTTDVPHAPHVPTTDAPHAPVTEAPGQGDECTELTQSNVTAYMGTAINAAVCWHTTCNGNMQLTFGAELFMTGWVKIAGDTSVTVNGGDLHGDITRTVAASGPVTISALVTGYRTSRCPSGWPNEWCYSRWVSTNLTNYVNFEWVCIDSNAPQTNTHPPTTDVPHAPHAPTTDAPHAPVTEAPGQGDECTELTQSNVTAYMGTAINAAVCWHTTCNGNMQLTFGAELFMTGWVRIAGDTSVTVNGGDLHGDITRTVAASGPVTISALVTGYRTSRCPSGWPNEWCYSRWVSTNLTNYVNFEWVCIDSNAPQTNTHPPTTDAPHAPHVPMTDAPHAPHTPTTDAPDTQDTNSPLTTEAPSSAAAVWCSSDTQCQEHGDTVATCDQNRHCTCGDGFVKPFDAASGRRAHICVTSNTKVSDVVHAAFDVACDGNSGKGARVAELVVDLVGGTVTDVREECGSLNVFVSVSDMPLLDVAAMDVAARLSEKVQASDLGLGDVLSAGLASVDDLQCETVPGVSDVSFIAGECVPIACSSGYTRVSTGSVHVCVADTAAPRTAAPTTSAPTTTTSAPDSGSSGLSTGAIVGICVGGGVLLLVAVAVAVAVCLLRKKTAVDTAQPNTHAPDAAQENNANESAGAKKVDAEV